MGEEAKEKREEDDWRIVLKFFALFALFAGVIRLGAEVIYLQQDVKQAQCRAAYWYGRANGEPKTYFPPGCWTW
ncbi:hypothetical protein P0R31_03255 [Bradyrhizobium yuanmingense]|uniref:hypothetical protein n=1 Tax=Bradyrhizobium yuanmingense TaxID=108015 RepID=UPI0023B97E14|nr:hypothetical protein [Bradyrhizobium yuanmingense]MDF0516257.1 hypothetical protein [Bradyrhizobium yuanmingense]